MNLFLCFIISKFKRKKKEREKNDQQVSTKKQLFVNYLVYDLKKSEYDFRRRLYYFPWMWKLLDSGLIH